VRRPPTQKSLEQIEGVLGEPWVRLKDHRARGSRAPSLVPRDDELEIPHMHVGWWGRAYIAFSGDPGEHGI